MPNAVKEPWSQSDLLLHLRSFAERFIDKSVANPAHRVSDSYHATSSVGRISQSIEVSWRVNNASRRRERARASAKDLDQRARGRGEALPDSGLASRQCRPGLDRSSGIEDQTCRESFRGRPARAWYRIATARGAGDRAGDRGQIRPPAWTPAVPGLVWEGNQAQNSARRIHSLGVGVVSSIGHRSPSHLHFNLIQTTDIEALTCSSLGPGLLDAISIASRTRSSTSCTGRLRKLGAPSCTLRASCARRSTRRRIAVRDAAPSPRPLTADQDDADCRL